MLFVRIDMYNLWLASVSGLKCYFADYLCVSCFSLKFVNYSLVLCVISDFSFFKEIYINFDYL